MLVLLYELIYLFVCTFITSTCGAVSYINKLYISCYHILPKRNIGENDTKKNIIAVLKIIAVLVILWR